LDDVAGIICQALPLILVTVTPAPDLRGRHAAPFSIQAPAMSAVSLSLGLTRRQLLAVSDLN
jgi:hypothetical protein